jgi:hypothetical protein
MQTNDSGPNAFVEMASNRIANHFAQLLNRFRLSEDAVPERTSHVPAFHRFLNTENDLAVHCHYPVVVRSV